MLGSTTCVVGVSRASIATVTCDRKAAKSNQTNCSVRERRSQEIRQISQFLDRSSPPQAECILRYKPVHVRSTAYRINNRASNRCTAIISNPRAARAHKQTLVGRSKIHHQSGTRWPPLGKGPNSCLGPWGC